MAQKTILSILQTAATELAIPKPNSVVSSQDANVNKLQAFMVAVCDDLLAEFDWQQLVVRYEFSTVSGQDSYPLPSDLFKFINGTFFDKNNRWPLIGPKTASQWEFLKNSLVIPGPFNQFRVFQHKMFLVPTPAATTYTFVFEYFSKNYVIDGSTAAVKPEFTQDSDICLFDHRLVVYGVKAKWLASLGQDNSDAINEYNRALSAAKGRDTPAPRLTLGGSPCIPFISTANIPDGNWGI